MPRKKLLIVGGGSLCLHILQILAPRNQFEFHVASRNLAQAERLCSLIRLGALQHDVSVQVQPWCMHLDEYSIDKNAATLMRIRPDIILNCASLQSWRVISQLPTAVCDALGQAQTGPWLPMDLAPAYALMRTVMQSGLKSLVINAAYPDAVNTVLYKIGMAPLMGVGSIANLVPATRSAIARLADVEPLRVRVKLLGQHFFSQYVIRSGLPPGGNFDLTYWIDGTECTDEFHPQDIFASVARHFQRLGGINGQYLTAMSAVSIIENLYADQEVHVHAPGPHGLPGGYPVKVGLGRVLLDLPYSLRRDVAIELNEQGQRQDGITTVMADGTVRFEPRHMAIMQKILGYGVAQMKIQDVAGHACELGRRYHEFADRIRQQGVTHHADQHRAVIPNHGLPH